MFVGRDRYLEQLSDQYRDVVRTREGRFVLVRGRRRVGKSRLVEEFLRREAPLAVYFTASRQPQEVELGAFAEALRQSDLPDADVLSEQPPASWEAALTTVATLASSTGPMVLVIDEFPYLVEGGDALAVEGTFQKLWDRVLQRLPILLVVIGSDLSMMRALTEYDRPLYGRPTKTITVRPFSPFEVADMLELEGRDALEAYLIVGGFPFVVGSWKIGETLASFLERSMSDPTSPLIVDGERALAAEFPPGVQARTVLMAIGGGERTFTALGRATGISQTSLVRALATLTDEKRVVAVDSPLSAKPSREKRYRIADPYLRFWVTFIQPALPEIERDLGGRAATRAFERWPDYRGIAVEPVVRESFERLLAHESTRDDVYVGRYWTRTGSTEVDLVLGSSKSAPTPVAAVGSIKWRESKPFDRRDHDDLARAASLVPGASNHTELVGVSATGFSSAGLDREIGPDDLLRAWDPGFTAAATSGRRGPP
ncbi:MAG: ATP-binding protein [Actinomycetota bacterium]|nr:ATP-binding protein [Actinomycetota bacterium]